MKNSVRESFLHKKLYLTVYCTDEVNLSSQQINILVYYSVHLRHGQTIKMHSVHCTVNSHYMQYISVRLL